MKSSKHPCRAIGWLLHHYTSLYFSPFLSSILSFRMIILVCLRDLVYFKKGNYGLTSFFFHTTHILLQMTFFIYISLPFYQFIYLLFIKQMPRKGDVRMYNRGLPHKVVNVSLLFRKRTLFCFYSEEYQRWSTFLGIFAKINSNICLGCGGLWPMPEGAP